MYREKTVTEVSNEFVEQIISYIESLSRDQPFVVREKLNCLAFKILAIIDGATSLPYFILAPDPHETDKKYCIENKENYFPQNSYSNVKCNISGELHEIFKKLIKN